ncbi:hypothetical protein D6D01_02197 [Aureobasidium pullulans]|uniref:Cytochrome P450 n=1 Tax=Aureobasidium pullulans TaxID=5580 RepID=A0A4S9LUH7_AURPU|nr:hypothetical protein D6D01_02197 [Aureobasidium pullulans]
MSFVLNTELERFHLAPKHVSWTLGALLTLYIVVRCFYNLFFHPLRAIPGPRLAAMSSLNEFYWDVLRDGQYIFKIDEMHKLYGPIVRISPTEIHIRDSEYYSKIYAGGTRKIEKDASTVAGFSVPSSVAATIDHRLHRARRGYMNPYFAKRAIAELAPMIKERVSKLNSRLHEALETKRHVSLDRALAAMTADIITTRFYGEHFDYLGFPDFQMPIRDAFFGVSTIFHFGRFFPALITALRKLPIPIIAKILPSVADFLRFEKEIKRRIDQMLNNEELAEKSKGSIILQALNDERIPESERSLARLLDEGLVIIFAGTETSSRALAVTMYHLLSDKDIIVRMRQELATIKRCDENGFSLQDLESLPYLNGVVNEGFRLAFGPVSRLPRVSVEEPLLYGDYVIPPGYPVAQSTYFVHTDPAVFPEPYKFDPARWVEAAEAGFPLKNYLVNFTKGSRQCLGINMAHAELYITLAEVFSTFDMELYNTCAADVGIDSVRIIGYPKKEKNQTGQGEVEVLVTGLAC